MSVIKFTDDHEWVVADENGEALVGITEYAQEQLGELVFIELPAVGDEISQGDACAVIESVKSASDLHSPVSGVVIEINEELDGDPGIVNEDALSAGWFIKIKLTDESELDTLMGEEQYLESLEEA